jgi:hypothetical protein
MNVGQLKEILNRTQDDDIEVVIDAQTYENGTMGGSDVAAVKWAGRGIDWDRNKFMLSPDIKLRAKEYRKYNPV